MDERADLVKRLYGKLDELANEYKDHEEVSVFLEKLRAWVKDNAENEKLKTKNKFLDALDWRGQELSVAFEENPDVDEALVVIQEWAQTEED